VSHFCDIWRHWSKNTSQLIIFCSPTNQECEVNRPRMNCLYGSTPLRTKRCHATIFGVNNSLLSLPNCAFLIDVGEQHHSCNRKETLCTYNYALLSVAAWSKTWRSKVVCHNILLFNAHICALNYMLGLLDTMPEEFQTSLRTRSFPNANLLVGAMSMDQSTL